MNGGPAAGPPPAEYVTHNFEWWKSYDIPEPRWVVPGLLPEGLAILAGPPKLGKSLLCFHLTVCIGSGSKVLGQLPTQQGDVLYVDFEDPSVEIRERLMELSESYPPMSEYTEIFHPIEPQEWRAKVEGWLERAKNPSLVILDTLNHILASEPESQESKYSWLHDQLRPLKRLAEERHCAVLLVHHTTKAKADNPFNAVYGNVAFQGIPDSVYVMFSAGEDKAQLRFRGRSLEEESMFIGRDGLEWTLDAASLLTEAPVQQRILDAIKFLGIEEFDITVLAPLLPEMSKNAVRMGIRKMIIREMIEKVSRGKWRLVQTEGQQELL